ncbi:MAG: PAS domain S-box protein [Halapricum sp.]
MSGEIRVLHVDDEPDFVDLTARYLEREAETLSVDTETGAEAALDRLEAERFDCVVSDYQMPGMDGLALLERLRERGDDVPFIIFTGKGREEVAIRALNLGADRYLQKGGDPKAQYQLLADAIQGIVEQRSTEAALAANRRRLSEIVEQIPLATFVLDKNHEITHWNAACERLLDVSTEEVVGTDAAGEAIYGTERPSLADLVLEDTSPPAMYQWYSDNWDHSDTLEDAYVVENEVPATGRWLRRVAAPLRDDNGERAGAIQTLVDVTDERERERELEATKETIEAIVEAAPVAIIGHDIDGKVTLWSDGAEELFGWSAEEAVGSQPPPFIPESDHEEFEANLQQVLDGETLTNHPITRETKDGEPIDLSLSTAPVRAGDDDLIGVVGVVTERTDDSDAKTLLDSLFEQFPPHLHLYVKDEQARHIEASDALYDADDLLGKTDYEVKDIAPEECESYLDDLRVIQQGESIIAKEELGNRDGRWLLTSKVPWYDDGEIVGLIGLSQDITERKGRERRLERLRNRFELALESTESGVIDWNLGTYAVRLHGRASALLGIDPDRETLTIDAFLDRIYPDDADRLQSMVGASPEGLDQFDIEYRVETDDGWRWIDSQGEIHYEDGEPVRVIGTLRDVTERKEREQDRRRHRQRITALHEVATALQASEDVTEVCERTVEAATEILSFDQCLVTIERDGVLEIEARTDGINAAEVAPLPTEEGIVGKTYRRGESFRVDDIPSDPDALSRDRFASLISVPIDERGVFQALAEGSGQFDDDDLELAKLLITHTSTALARLDRGAALREQKRTLERQNERLDQFAGIVSHDLRNPLQVAQSRLELAREAESPAEHLDAVADMHDRMSKLLSEVLELAREGDRVTDPERISLAHTARAAWDAVVTDGATLTVESDATIEADPDGIHRLFENLFRNSIEHGSTDDECRATVHVGVLEGGDGFYVADDGPGIDPADRDRVFESGFSTVSGGTGYGLSIVREIAQAHDWTVGVTESASGGARFEIRGVTVLSVAEADD